MSRANTIFWYAIQNRSQGALVLCCCYGESKGWASGGSTGLAAKTGFSYYSGSRKL